MDNYIPPITGSFYGQFTDGKQGACAAASLAEPSWFAQPPSYQYGDSGNELVASPAFRSAPHRGMAFEDEPLALRDPSENATLFNDKLSTTASIDSMNLTGMLSNHRSHSYPSMMKAPPALMRSVMTPPAFLMEDDEEDANFNRHASASKNDDVNKINVNVYQLTTNLNMSSSPTPSPTSPLAENKFAQNSPSSTTTSSTFTSAANKFSASNPSSTNETCNTSELPACPVWVEKFYSVLSPNPADTVVEALTAFLSERQVDYDVASSGDVIKGVMEGNSTCPFTICLFSWSADDAARLGVDGIGQNDPNVVLVEFNRNGGCALQFSTFFRHAVQSLGDKVSRALQLPAAMPSSTDRPSFPQRSASNPVPPSSASASASAQSFGSPYLSPAIKLDPSLALSLLSMVESSSLDVQREAVQNLAHLSADSQNCLMIIAQARAKARSANIPCDASDLPCQLVHLVANVLQSADQNVSRCASQLLSNMCAKGNASENQQRVLLASMLPLLSQKVCRSRFQELLSRQTKRLVTDALNSLSDTAEGAEVMKSDAALTEELSHAMDNEDCCVKIKTVLGCVMKKLHQAQLAAAAAAESGTAFNSTDGGEGAANTNNNNNNNNSHAAADGRGMHTEQAQHAVST